MTDTQLATKAESAFRTISEVADELGVQQHVLRFWETKFTQVKPLKRGGGRRYYRPEDVALLKKIHTLLYAEGYTIKGVQKLLKGVSKVQVLAEQRAVKAEVAQEAPVRAYGESLPKLEVASQTPVKPDEDNEHVLVLKSVLDELLEMREQVQALLSLREEDAA